MFASYVRKAFVSAASQPWKSSCFVVSGTVVTLHGLATTFSPSRPNEDVELRDLNEDLGLPSQDAAQGLPAVTRRNILSREEIAKIISRATEDMHRLGTTSRDADGVHKLRGPWETMYLHTDGWFKEAFPDIHSRLVQVTVAADKDEWGLLDAAPVAMRCGVPVARNIEMHTVYQDGALPDPDHFDSGSLWTIDVMLAQIDEDYDGGVVQTLGKDGQLISHRLDCGDALIFPSHKCHCVSRVTRGRRRVLVMELWHGEERTCAHRCCQRWGLCSYSLVMSRLDRVLRAGSPHSDDPAPLF